jgi:hypothetical protein
MRWLPTHAELHHQRRCRAAATLRAHQPSQKPGTPRHHRVAAANERGGASMRSRLSAPTTTAAKSPPPHDLHSNLQLCSRSGWIRPPRRQIRGPECRSCCPGTLPRGMPPRRRERPRRRLPRGHRTSGSLLRQQRDRAVRMEGAPLPAGDAATRVAPAGATREPCGCYRGVNCIFHAFGVNI